MFAGFLFSFYLYTRFHFVTKRNSLLLSFVDSMRKWLQLWHDFVSPTPHLHVFLTMQVVSASSSLSHCSLVLRNSVATVASVLLFYCLSLAFYAAKLPLSTPAAESFQQNKNKFACIHCCISFCRYF